MNREEAIEVIKGNRWVFSALGWSLPADDKEIKEFNEAIKVLEQPTTLADSLGWEVGVAYKDEDGSIFCLRAPNDLRKYREANGWWGYHIAEWTNYEFDKLQRAEKVEHKKKYRIPLPHLTTTDGMRVYLTEGDDHWFASRLNETLKQEWTEDELCNVPEFYQAHAKEIVE